MDKVLLSLSLSIVLCMAGCQKDQAFQSSENEVQGMRNSFRMSEKGDIESKTCLDKDSNHIKLLTAFKDINQAQKAVVENITNSKAIGYKRNLVRFVDSNTISVKRDFSQGELLRTDRSLDIAILGRGFFCVVASDGSVFYTRRGDFEMDSSGLLQLTGGYALEPAISMPADTANISITEDGTVLCQNSSDSEMTTVGSIQLSTFQNVDGLSYRGNGLFVKTEFSGSPVIAAPKSGGAGGIRPGFIESSNVNEKKELWDLEELKAFEDQIQNALDILKNKSNDIKKN